jgi:hypothetical protein
MRRTLMGLIIFIGLMHLLNKIDEFNKPEPKPKVEYYIPNATDSIFDTIYIDAIKVRPGAYSNDEIEMLVEDEVSRQLD